jgi:hypothetical protein
MCRRSSRRIPPDRGFRGACVVVKVRYGGLHIVDGNRRNRSFSVDAKVCGHPARADSSPNAHDLTINAEAQVEGRSPSNPATEFGIVQNFSEDWTEKCSSHWHRRLGQSSSNLNMRDLSLGRASQQTLNCLRLSALERRSFEPHLAQFSRQGGLCVENSIISSYNGILLELPAQEAATSESSRA